MGGWAKVAGLAAAFAVWFALWGCGASGAKAGAAASTAKSAPKEQRADIDVLMKKYAVVPDVIRVKRGTTVHLHVRTADVQHGFDIPDLDISEPVNPGRTTDITFVADKPGTYRIECGILCGPGHDDMTGKFVVE